MNVREVDAPGLLLTLDPRTIRVPLSSRPVRVSVGIAARVGVAYALQAAHEGGPSLLVRRSIYVVLHSFVNHRANRGCEGHGHRPIDAAHYVAGIVLHLVDHLLVGGTPTAHVVLELLCEAVEWVVPLLPDVLHRLNLVGGVELGERVAREPGHALNSASNSAFKIFIRE